MDIVNPILGDAFGFPLQAVVSPINVRVVCSVPESGSIILVMLGFITVLSVRVFHDFKSGNFLLAASLNMIN